MPIYFGGSRHLAPHLVSLNQVIQATHEIIHVGCCMGADQQVIQRALPSSLVVFAAFAQGGAGAWSGSAVQAVKQAAQAGAVVHWLAGGPLSLPLPVRLIRRSVAALVGCSSAVFFCPGPGSLAVAARAVHSMPVFAFAPSAPIPGQVGRWVPSQFGGFSCWVWSSAQAALF